MPAPATTDRGRVLLIDGFAAATLFIMLVLPFSWFLGIDSGPVMVLWSGIMVASVTVRRASPLLAIGIATFAGAGMVVQLSSPSPALLVVPVIVYSAARYLPGHRRLVLPPIILAASLAGPISWVQNVGPSQRFVIASVMALVCLAACAVAYLTGLRMRDFSRLEELDRELTKERFTTGAIQTQQQSDLAMERVRNEVARELHDVVAHSLSVIVVQAEGARALLEKQPEAARDALDVIAQTGRSSIGEMRKIVGLLRGDDVPDFEPSPGLADIGRMVAKASNRIHLIIPDEHPQVPESLGLTGFRIVQEAVTNFLKHAGPEARATVEVRYFSEEIAIRIVDDGAGSAATTPRGGGSGLRGMRERVNTMRGTLAAGPRIGGGYQVAATLPIPPQLGRGWLR